MKHRTDLTPSGIIGNANSTALCITLTQCSTPCGTRVFSHLLGKKRKFEFALPAECDYVCKSNESRWRWQVTLTDSQAKSILNEILPPICNGERDPEDLRDHLMFTVIKRLQNRTDIDNLEAYVRKTASMEKKRWAKRRAVSAELTFDPPQHGKSPLEFMVEEEERRGLLRSISELRPLHRDILVAIYGLGPDEPRSARDLAIEYQISDTSIRKIRDRGRLVLRAKLDPDNKAASGDI